VSNLDKPESKNTCPEGTKDIFITFFICLGNLVENEKNAKKYTNSTGVLLSRYALFNIPDPKFLIP